MSVVFPTPWRPVSAMRALIAMMADSILSSMCDKAVADEWRRSRAEREIPGWPVGPGGGL